MQGCQSTNVTVCWYFPLGQVSSCLRNSDLEFIAAVVGKVQKHWVDTTINWVWVLSQLSPGNPMSVTTGSQVIIRLWFAKTNISQSKVSVPRPSVAMAILCRFVVSYNWATTDMGMLTLTPELFSDWSLRTHPGLWLAVTDLFWWHGHWVHENVVIVTTMSGLGCQSSTNQKVEKWAGDQ